MGIMKLKKIELKLYQARNSNLSKSKVGNMGVLEEISRNPKILSFASDRVRYEITKAEGNPFNFVYNVDVEVKLKDETKDYSDHNNIKEYEVLKLYASVNNEDLFDDNNE